MSSLSQIEFQRTSFEAPDSVGTRARVPREAPEQCDQIGRFFWTLGNFLKPLATMNLPKSPTFLANFCKDVKIYHFASEIIFGQLL